YQVTFAGLVRVLRISLDFKQLNEHQVLIICCV
ncbi:hypothetical protein AVEN_15961-1, partial [Araneus ventricosus]